MKVSIIIPTYNVERYIRECLESVAAQTWEGELECIVVNDCGTDDSIRVAEEFFNGYSGRIAFSIVHREKNGGLSAARNSGTEAATGDWLYYLDSDDAITPDCIAQLVAVAEQHPEAEIVQGGCVDMDGRRNFDATTAPLPDLLTDHATLYREMTMGNVPVSSWNKLIRRSFIVEHGIAFREGVIHEDVDYAYKLARHVGCLALCRANTYRYRNQREGSILNTTNSDRSTSSRLVIYGEVLGMMDERDRQTLTRSLFLRLQYVLLAPPQSSELRADLRALCQRVAQEATDKDRCWMRLYFRLPHFLQTRLYNVFGRKAKR